MMCRIAAILAGGKGTRLGSLTKSLPKPMLPVAGRPILEYHVEAFTRYGVERIYMLNCHQAEIIENHFGDGSRFDVDIVHVLEKAPMGTAGAVKALQAIMDEPFFLSYGDVLFNMKLDDLAKSHGQNTAATLVVHPTDHPQDSDLIEVERTGRVRKICAKPHLAESNGNLGNAAFYCLSPIVFDYISSAIPSDFMQDVFPNMLASGEALFAYRTAEYIRDIGTPERLAQGNADVLAGKLSGRSRETARPAVFFDRDGTLIRDKELLTDPDALELFADAAQAIRRLNEAGILTILTTNQPVVARGLCSLDDVARVNGRLEWLLSKKGGILDEVFFCPHHPDAGYPGENPAFKVSCRCRKPGTGMIEEAASRMHIDLGRSWIVGDSTVDIQTGVNAGLETVLVKTGLAGRDGKYKVQPDYEAKNLDDAIAWILSQMDMENCR